MLMRFGINILFVRQYFVKIWQSLSVLIDLETWLCSRYVRHFISFSNLNGRIIKLASILKWAEISPSSTTLLKLVISRYVHEMFCFFLHSYRFIRKLCPYHLSMYPPADHYSQIENFFHKVCIQIGCSLIFKCGPVQRQRAITDTFRFQISTNFSVVQSDWITNSFSEALFNFKNDKKATKM